VNPPEELKLVESFDELRTGMLVELRDCPLCRKPERFQLVKQEQCVCNNQEACGGSVWITDPPCPRDGNAKLAGDAVRDRVLFHVVASNDERFLERTRARRQEDHAARPTSRPPMPAPLQSPAR